MDHPASACVARHHRLRVVAAAGLLLLGACSGGGVFSRRGEATPVAAPIAPSDPIVVFAANARPGAASRIALADGRPAPVRMTRSYSAASGRECREVAVGTGSAQRLQLVCQGEGGEWVQARPLLRGAGVARPGTARR